MFKGNERIIKIPGFEIAVKEWGNPEGKPVLALHGWIDNAASFDFLAPLLPELHIIAMDSPGCGHSSHRALGSIPSVIDEIFFTLQVANELGWDKFILMGHSRGGVIAQMVAAGAPERIRALILLDIVGMIMGNDVVDRLRNVIKKNIDQPIKQATLYPDLDAATQGRLASSKMKFDSAYALTERGTEKSDGGYKWTFDRRELAFNSPIIFTKDLVILFLSGIEAPTCIILGDRGLISSNPLLSPLLPEIISYIKNCQLHNISGDHHVHMDSPEIVAKIISDFTTNL